MVARVRIGISLRPAIISVVPSHHIYFIGDKKLQPESIWGMHLLLVKLGVRVEENHGGLLQVLWKISVHLIFGENLIVIEGEEHAVKLFSILALHHESPPIKIVLEHLL